MSTKQTYLDGRDISNTAEPCKLTVGTNEWGSRTCPQSDIDNILSLCVENGVYRIDTAPVYPTIKKGMGGFSAESCIGEFFQKIGNRSRFEICSKFRHIYDFSMSDFEAQTRKGILEQIHCSLKNMGTDHIEYFSTYNPVDLSRFGNKSVAMEYPSLLIDILNGARVEGLIGAHGFSNETDDTILGWLGKGKTEVQCNNVFFQSRWSLLDDDVPKSVLSCSLQPDSKLMVYASLAQGYLTGKYLSRSFLPDSRKYRLGGMQRYETKAAKEAVLLYAKIADQYETSLLSLSMQSAMRQCRFDTVTIGMKSLVQAEACIAALQVRLPSTAITKALDVKRFSDGVHGSNAPAVN